MVRHIKNNNKLLYNKKKNCIICPRNNDKAEESPVVACLE